jgi:molybdate transport system ATP-binding protein
VAGFDDELELTHLTLLGHRLYTAKVAVNVGDTVRLRIRARDVALALTPPTGTSILNQLPVVVSEVVAGSGSHAEVALTVTAAPRFENAKPQTVLARITRKSLNDLSLRPGVAAYALIKAVAIDRHSLGGLGNGANRNTP